MALPSLAAAFCMNFKWIPDRRIDPDGFAMVIIAAIFVILGILISVGGVISHLENHPTPTPTPTPNITGCTRTSPYHMPSEFMRAISLINERFNQYLDQTSSGKAAVNSSSFHLGDFYNCLDIKYGQLGSNAEGYFVFDPNSSPNDLRIYVDSKYSGYDDLLTAILLSHELSHVLQLEDYWIYGTKISCVDQEVQAFTVEYEFVSALNSEEKRSLASRIAGFDNYNEYGIVEQFSMVYVNAMNLCGSDTTCYWNDVNREITQMVVSNPYYQQECHL